MEVAEHRGIVVYLNVALCTVLRKSVTRKVRRIDAKRPGQALNPRRTTDQHLRIRLNRCVVLDGLVRSNLPVWHLARRSLELKTKVDQREINRQLQLRLTGEVCWVVPETVEILPARRHKGASSTQGPNPVSRQVKTRRKRV